MQALHHQMAQKWREVRDANDIKKLKLKRERNKKRAQEASARTQRQSKLAKQDTEHGGDKVMRLEQPRKDVNLQKRYDAARVLFCSKTFTSFRAMQYDEILVQALLPNSYKRVVNKSRVSISRHTGEKADMIRRDMLSILLSAKEYTKSFAFTSDMSKTNNLYSLISLTVHFIAPDGELIMLNLHSDYFGEHRHTGTNILFCLQSMMHECGLDDDSIGRYIVLDNASNNKRAMNLGSDKYDVVWCVIHTLQLAIKVI